MKKDPNIYTVTAIADAATNDLVEIEKARAVAMRLGLLRKDLWSKFGGVQAWGEKSSDLVTSFSVSNPYKQYNTDFKCWANTTQQVIDDIQMTHAAMRTSVFRKIYRRYSDAAERKAQFKKLRTKEYLTDNVLHRWVRDSFGRGRTYVDNHIVLCHKNGAIFNRKNRITEVVFNGLPLENSTRYEKITLKFKTGRVDLAGYGTVIFHDDGVMRLHYPVHKEKVDNDTCESLGVDKGYTEALYGTDGKIYGADIGKIMTVATEKRDAKMRIRHKLRSVFNKTNNINILKNNLGRLKLNNTTRVKKAHVTSIIRCGTNEIFKNYRTVIAEDLSVQIKNKRMSRKVNRKLSDWVKGEIQKALEEGAMRTYSTVVNVNAAYTSQEDAQSKTLLGVRKGDRFIRFNGEVIQADYNASHSINNRLNDKDITRYMKHGDVHKILIKRTACFLIENGLSVEDLYAKGLVAEKHYTAIKKFGISELTKGLETVAVASTRSTYEPKLNCTFNQAVNKRSNYTNYADSGILVTV